MKLIIAFLALIGGAAVAIQSQINAQLSKKVGVLEGATTSFLVGAVALFFLAFFFGKGNFLNVFNVPKWQLIGGLLGALFIVVNIFSVNLIGVAATLMAVVIGQIVVGAIIDHFGLFGGEVFPLNTTKFIALTLMFVGIYLFNKA
ncbi:DMT family transporter [Solibacillus merdavium]|uniref:DMT family transporter n=1 Tax=Solibacillus merdavium TaxID=2762218 RepID=A0ABR8XN52_9BACL|nr:DMT family transporter [Solibacillus merdavium]MBD8033364.1 DMT family transporter [Solibacillus merdavium]